MFVAALVCLQQPALFRFIEAPDDSFSMKLKLSREIEGRKVEVYELVSQTWKGKPWQHSLELHQPAVVENKATAVLWITGGKGTDDPDAKLARRVADIAGMPVAVLYDVPNQPLFDKLREDSLIAYTFGKFLESKDESWPLLCPMTKSAIKAMDGIVAETATTSNPIRRFIIAGESKRGWTTLLASAYDKRVLAEVPMAFDFLNFSEQLKRQRQTWGRLSPMFEAYAGIEPEEAIRSDLGKVLVGLVDPFAYVSRLYKPKLIMRGSSDPFWTADALSVYWTDLPGGKLACVMPNVGHVVSEDDQVRVNLGLFAKLTAREEPAPLLKGEWRKGSGSWTYNAVAPGAKSVKLWFAENSNSDFSKVEWRVGAAHPALLRLPKSDSFTASFVQATFQVGAESFTLTSVPRIFPPSTRPLLLPHQN